MFADDISLVAEMVAKYGPVAPPFVECGGLESPCIADYAITIEAMRAIRDGQELTGTGAGDWPSTVKVAQHARYLSIHRPLENVLPGYACEDPGNGGLAIENLWTKYRDLGIGVAVLLSVLEHVAHPFDAAIQLRRAVRPGGLAIVSVPFIFPYHPSPEDHWRFTPSGLRKVFNAQTGWEVLEADWRLDIPAEAGVLDIRTGKAQIIRSCYCAARAV